MKRDPFEALADYIIEESGYQRANHEVVVYSLRILNNTVWGLVVIACIGVILQMPKVVLVSALATAALRVFSGGAHASASSRCVMGGGVVFGMIGVGIKNFEFFQNYATMWQLLLLLILGVIVIFLFAPADTPNKPIASKLQRTVLRSISFIVFISLWFTLAMRALTPLYSWAIFCGLSWQIFSLTPIGYQSVKRLDKGLQAMTLVISKLFWKSGDVVNTGESERR